MKVEIIHNGSKWSDEEPNSIEDLMSLLKTEPLNFLAMYREDDCLELVGNFVNVSNVFRVKSNSIEFTNMCISNIGSHHGELLNQSEQLKLF